MGERQAHTRNQRHVKYCGDLAALLQVPRYKGPRNPSSREPPCELFISFIFGFCTRIYIQVADTTKIILKQIQKYTQQTSIYGEQYWKRFTGMHIDIDTEQVGSPQHNGHKAIVKMVDIFGMHLRIQSRQNYYSQGRSDQWRLLCKLVRLV